MSGDGVKTKKRQTRKPSLTQTRKKLDASLSELERAELVRALVQIEPAYFFKHALVQDTAQSTLLHGQFKHLNLLVAEAYEKIYPAQALNEYAAVLAQHYDAAGNDAKTLHYATRAGDLAAHLYANTEAIGYYTHAIDHAQKIADAGAALRELFTKRGRLYELRGSHDAALANYDEMEKVAQARGDRALELGALMARATIHSTPTMQFDPAHARSLCENALALARTLHDRAAEAKILWNLMLLSHYSAQYEQAIAYGVQAIALARELNLREQLAYALNDISRVYFTLNQPEQGIAAAQEATGLWRGLDNQPMLADNLNTLATFYANVGESERALALTGEAYQLAQQINNPWAMAHSCMANSFVYFETGQVNRALDAMQECLQLAQTAGFLIALVTMHISLARTFAMLGDVPRAIAFLQTETRDANTPKAGEANTLGILAQLYIQQGELERARVTLQTSHRALAQGATNPFVGGAVALAEAELALAEGDHARALTLIDAQLETLNLGRMRWLYVDALLLRARVLFALGRLSDAIAALESLRETAVRAGSRRLHWQILAQRADIAKQRGDAASAAADYAAARGMLEYIAAHTPDEYRESFLNTPAVQHVLQQGTL